jgi:hypothetical protein
VKYWGGGGSRGTCRSSSTVAATFTWTASRFIVVACVLAPASGLRIVLHVIPPGFAEWLLSLDRGVSAGPGVECRAINGSGRSRRGDKPTSYLLPVWQLLSGGRAIRSGRELYNSDTGLCKHNCRTPLFSDFAHSPVEMAAWLGVGAHHPQYLMSPGSRIPRQSA